MTENNQPNTEPKEAFETKSFENLEENQNNKTTSDTIEELTKQIENLSKQLEGEKARANDNFAHWQRAQADFSNFRKRVEQEKNDLIRYANALLISRILPILDDFDRAAMTLPKELEKFTWIEGFFLMRAKLWAFLQQEGVTPIEAINKDFDPILHEAVSIEEGVEPSTGKIVSEFQRGYKMHDRVLRPSLVKVGKGTPQNTETNPKDSNNQPNQA